MNRLSERYSEDFAVGQTFGSGRLAAEFDPQPFHLDEAAARYYNGVRTHRSTEQRCAGLSPASADWNHSFTPDTRRASSPLRPGLSFRCRGGGVMVFPWIRQLVR